MCFQLNEHRRYSVWMRAADLCSLLSGTLLSVLFHFHPFLAILNDSLGGDFLAINDFGGSRHGPEVPHPTITASHGEGRRAPIPLNSKGTKSCI